MRSFFMMPPADGSHNPINLGARSYSCAIGSVVTVVCDADREALMANGWIVSSAGGSGATSARPDPAQAGRQAQFHDTTLGKIIVSDGKTWRDPHTGAAA